MKILLSIFIALIVLSLSLEVQTKKITKAKKDITITEKTKKLYDKTKNPKNPRTKLNLIKVVIHGFLDQLDLPKRVIHDKISEAGTKNLMKTMAVLKNVNRGLSKSKELMKLKTFLKYPAVADRLKNKKFLKNAIKYLKKFFKK